MTTSNTMKLAGIYMLVLAYLAPTWVHAQLNPATSCEAVNRNTNYRQCPAGRGSTCYVEVQGNGNYRGTGCGTCTRRQNTYECSDFTFVFRSRTEVEVRVTTNRVTRVNVASFLAANGRNQRVCRTTGSPVGGRPFRLTSPEGNLDSIQICYNPVNCGYGGSMCGDPKIVGGDGVMFYFHGYKNADFCLVSDSDLQINAHFIGKRPPNRTRDFTWVQALGFVYGPNALTVGVKKVAKWDAAVDHLEFTLNGKAFSMEGSSWSSPDETITINRIGARNSVDLVVRRKMGVTLTAVPIGHEENRVHKYGITDDDCFAHFNMQFRFYSLSTHVNGVLGQTYQEGYKNPVNRNVAMPIMGGADRYITSSLLATDCKVNQYSATPVETKDQSHLPNLASCGSGTSGILMCRR